MSARSFCLLAVLGALLVSWSSSVPADEGLTFEQAKQSVDEMIDAIEADFDCRVTGVSVKALPRSSPSARRYFIEYRGEGKRCNEAHAALSDRGRPEGLIFWRSIVIEEPDDSSGEPILDLINEINPPLDP